MEDNLKNIIESLIFVSDTPVDMPTLRKVLPDVEARELRQAVMELIEYHEARQGGFILREVAGGWQFRTRPEYKEWVKRLVQPPPARLSKAALETLAIIAYHQPIIRSDVEHIRGVDSGAILRGLLERKLIRILGKKEIPGRPLIYGTTKRFLEVFNLRNLSDMPSLKEIEAFGQAVTGDEEDGLGDEVSDEATDETTDETPGDTTDEAGEDVAEEMIDEENEQDGATAAALEDDAPEAEGEADFPGDQESDISTDMADQAEEIDDPDLEDADDAVAFDESVDDAFDDDIEKTDAPNDKNDA